MGETLIDAQFQKSPLPVLRAARALRSLPPGARLRILATDQAALADFRDFCKTSGHALIAASETRGVYSLTLKAKAEPDSP
ncbi:MAG: sulfurtransferase TusA family protein [Acidocella sp.]|nr:sulfurtransferase TusA family protein [Acidocella sp.]